MSKNSDGSITIESNEITGIDMLIIHVNRFVRDKDFYTSADEISFVHKWTTLKNGE